MGVIGLTGGIACGKTLASNYLSRLGADIIDADEITRRLYVPGSPLLEQIADTFGRRFLLDNGYLDRKALRGYIFEDEARADALNRIVHPAIRRQTLEDMNRSTKEHQVLVVPLLIESGYMMFCDEIWVMYLPIAEQKRRLMARDEIDEALAEAIIKRQLSFDEKAKYADCVIDNTGKPLATKRQISKEYRKFIKNNY